MTAAPVNDEARILAAISALGIKINSIGSICAEIVAARKNQTEAAAGQSK